MSKQFLTKFKEWDATYGKLAVWFWRIIFYPIVALVLYAANSYLSQHYVSRPYFDKAMSTIAEDKSRYALEQKIELKEISGKLDILLIGNAATGQRLNDSERRISKAEDRIDRLQGN